jgi:hypothetical protein
VLDAGLLQLNLSAIITAVVSHRELFIQKYTSDLLIATRKWEMLDLKCWHNDNEALLQHASIRKINSEMLMGRAYSSIVEKRHACTVLEGKPEVKIPFGRSRHSGRIILKLDRKNIYYGRALNGLSGLE